MVFSVLKAMRKVRAGDLPLSCLPLNAEQGDTEGAWHLGQGANGWLIGESAGGFRWRCRYGCGWG